MWMSVPQITAQPSDKRTTDQCSCMKPLEMPPPVDASPAPDVGKRGRKRVRFFTRREDSSHHNLIAAKVAQCELSTCI